MGITGSGKLRLKREKECGVRRLRTHHYHSLLIQARRRCGGSVRSKHQRAAMQAGSNSFQRVREKSETLVIDKKDPLSACEDIQWSEGQVEPEQPISKIVTSAQEPVMRLGRIIERSSAAGGLR
jgi:hypothetical protein